MESVFFSNLTSPPLLFFILGLLAALVRSDLEIPEQVAKFLSIYLLFAIGLKGGLALAANSIDGQMFVVLGAALLNIFFAWPALFLAVNAGIILVMSGLILHETSAIIHGGETNYIMATASLFLSIINLFQALLHLLGAFSGDD